MTHRSTQSFRARRAAVALLALAAGVGTTTTVAAPSASAAVGSDDFRAGQVYRGDFPDPSVMRLGDTYYAYSTNTGGKLLPAMSSSDLTTWRARPSSTGKWWKNDALAEAPRWATRHHAHGKWRVSTWAPSVAAVGGSYVAAYVAPVSETPRKMCITLAYASAPLGPFVDPSRGPLVCPPDQGAIDPELLVDKRTGRVTLLWKTEGIAHHAPTRIWSQRLNGTATAFARGSEPVTLLTTEGGWEGNLIENPSMVRLHSWYYLFYSANDYRTSGYAVGYAICRTPLGPCKRPSSAPLLATGGSVSGPGGADAFYDRTGTMRLAYAAWDRGRVGYPASNRCRSSARGCNQRTLHVAALAVATDLTLRVTDRG
ncbi:MAG: glycoside hydrolase family 43 protein [Nocardioidaceae bacterium]